MGFAVLTDFGSTFTKVVCVDLDEYEIIATDKFPSTVHTDAGIALNQCYDVAKMAMGKKNFEEALKLSTSSAAGGLRMAVVGLTKTISLQAGRNASFSAGAKIVCNTSGLITSEDIEQIENSQTEIILLCGGHESGNTKGVIENARRLSKSSLTLPVIYAGNSHIAETVRKQFLLHGKECFLTKNILSTIGSLHLEPTTKIIRNLFMKRIINMKGVGIVQDKMNAAILPTPAAVLNAGELLCHGTAKSPGIGELMMVDVGGATTDVYSYINNISYEGAKCVGIFEPFSKRTVEGDMGMRESSVCLEREIGLQNLAARCEVKDTVIENAIYKRITDRGYVADNAVEKKIDHQIACAAVEISARRHAGYISKEYHNGCRLIQHGKNLTGIETVIGTGGIIVNDSNPDDILKKVTMTDKEKGTVLLPSYINVLVDREYVLFAAGLLKKFHEEAALAIMKKSLGLS